MGRDGRRLNETGLTAIQKMLNAPPQAKIRAAAPSIKKIVAAPVVGYVPSRALARNCMRGAGVELGRGRPGGGVRAKPRTRAALHEWG